jgi:hypothetical protein
MAQAFLLSIDLNLIQDHFAGTGEPMSIEGIETWLGEMGFHRNDAGWVAEEISLDALDRSEYRAVRPL